MKVDVMAILCLGKRKYGEGVVNDNLRGNNTSMYFYDNN